jgi:23S rRNA (guanine745-N1)-methyltransferase
VRPVTQRGALAAALPLLRCPICHSDLTPLVAAVRCGNEHAFDVAKQGYLSLLHGKRPRHTGDTAAMISARERFLGAGHFEPLAEAVTAAVADAAGGQAVLDVGAGPGWYLGQALEGQSEAPGIAVDVSKPALRRAARAHPRAAAVAADVWGELPLRDGAAGAVLNVFAPRNPAEMARVLAPAGVAVIVTPTQRHLRGLIEPLGLIGVDERKEERLEDQLAPHLAIGDREELEWEMELDREAVRDLASMGPSAFHVEPAELDAKLATLGEPMRVTASVTVTRARRPR